MLNLSYFLLIVANSQNLLHSKYRKAPKINYLAEHYTSNDLFLKKMFVTLDSFQLSLITTRGSIVDEIRYNNIE